MAAGAIVNENGTEQILEPKRENYSASFALQDGMLDRNEPHRDHAANGVDTGPGEFFNHRRQD